MLEGRSRGGSGGSASTHTTTLSGAVADREAEVAPPELVGTDGRDHQGNEGAAAQPPHRAVVVPAAVGGQAERRHRPLHRTQAARIYESGLPRHLGAPQRFSTPKRHARRCWECRCPACETHRRSVGLSQPIHTQARSAIIKSATPALGAQIAGGAASATAEGQAALDEYYREQGLLGGNSMSTHVSRCVRS